MTRQPRHNPAPRPVEVVYRQAEGINPAEAQRRLRSVYRLLLEAARRPSPKLL